jgi:hypothetical protein
MSQRGFNRRDLHSKSMRAVNEPDPRGRRAARLLRRVAASCSTVPGLKQPRSTPRPTSNVRCSCTVRKACWTCFQQLCGQRKPNPGEEGGRERCAVVAVRPQALIPMRRTRQLQRVPCCSACSAAQPHSTLPLRFLVPTPARQGRVTATLVIHLASAPQRAASVLIAAARGAGAVTAATFRSRSTRPVAAAWAATDTTASPPLGAPPAPIFTFIDSGA